MLGSSQFDYSRTFNDDVVSLAVRQAADAGAAAVIIDNGFNSINIPIIVVITVSKIMVIPQVDFIIVYGALRIKNRLANDSVGIAV